MTNPELYIRQTDLADPEELASRIMIVGAGGIGSWTTLALLKMGCENVTVIDFDEIEIHNAGSQLYGSWDAGKTKVQALKDRLASIVDLHPTGIIDQVTESNVLGVLAGEQIVISAVDSIEIRKLLFNALKGTEKRFIDGRMAGNAIEIYSIPMNDPEKVALYEETLFPPEEAIHVECSSRAVIYNCFVIAGLITDIVARWSKGEEVPAELIVDLQNFTMFN